MSQLDSVTETLDGQQFEVFKLDPIKSLEALNVVKDVVAPALGSVLGTVESVDQIRDMLDEEGGAARVGDAVERLLSAASVERQKQLIETFKPVTHVDGKPLKGSFDLVFRGNLPLMFDWLKLCFTAEWGNVGGAIKSAIGGAIARVDSPPKSPTTSNTDGPSSTSRRSGRSRRSRRS